MIMRLLKRANSRVLTADVIQGRWDRPVNRGKCVYNLYIYASICIVPMACCIEKGCAYVLPAICAMLPFLFSLHDRQHLRFMSGSNKGLLRLLARRRNIYILYIYTYIHVFRIHFGFSDYGLS